MSLSSLGAGILSKSELSKFERGLTDVSTDKFIALLQRMHVTFAEFEHALTGIDGTYQQKIWNEITDALLNENEDQAAAVLEKAVAHYQKDPTEYNHLLQIMVKALICDMQGEKLPLTDVKILADYLFRVDGWTHFELFLFGNTMAVLPLETVNELTREMGVRTISAREVDSNMTIVINVLFNGVWMNLEVHDPGHAQLFLQLMNECQVPERMMSERFMIAFAKSLYAEYEDTSLEHQQQLLTLPNAQKLVGSEKLYLLFREQANDFINETNH